MKKQQYLVVLTLLCSVVAVAQFALDGQFKPRTEYRHGFGSIIPQSADAGFAVSTRIRLNTSYTIDTYQFYISLQDVLVWGENRQILPDDQNDSFAVFEAWAAINLGNGWSTKLGRQILSYDDQRIFGGLDWAQQARHHDAGLLHYKKEKFKMAIGLAFSQDFDNPTGFQSIGTTFNTSGFFTYKTMQYAHINNQWNNLSASALLLNNGFQNFVGTSNGSAAEGVSNLQTFGTHLNYKKESFGATLNAFMQTGERQNKISVKNAFLVGLDFNYQATEKIVLGIGAEIISGNDNPSGETGAFFPLYGTNHKFNGFMDYFYVGNHGNSIGLIDLHASAKVNLGNQSKLLVKILNFSGATALPSGEKSLGTEVDLVFTKQFSGYGLALGYSQMFADNGMSELKGIAKEDAASIQNWAWVQLTLKPKFLNTAKE